MRNRKYIVIGLIIILMLSIGCVDSNPSEKTTIKDNIKSEKSIDINYSASKVTSIGEFTKVKEGKVFLIVTMEIKNNGYDKFSVNPLFFGLIADNVKYNSDANTFQLPDGMQAIDLMNGGTSKSSMVFEVPSNIGNYQIKYEGFGTYNINYQPK